MHLLVPIRKYSGNCCFRLEQITVFNATHGLEVRAVRVAVPGEGYIHVAKALAPAVV